MKICTAVSLVLALFFIHPTAFTQSQLPPIDTSVSRAPRQFIVADIAGFPFNHTHSGTWRPNQSLRIGYGRELGSMLELRVCAEYSTFDFDNHDGLDNQDYSSGNRRDFAFYPAIMAFGVYEFAVGGYYTIQDEVFHHSFSRSQQVIDPVVKKFGFYYHFGAGTSIHVAGPVNITLGLVLRNLLKENVYFGCRAGLKCEL